MPASWHFRRHRATSCDSKTASYRRGVTGSNPVAPTRFSQLGGLFETLIGGPVTTAGNHRCMLPDGGRVPMGPWQHPFRLPGRAVRRRQALPALERHAGLKDPRRPALLMHACIVVSLMAGVRPEEARAIGWEEAGAKTRRPSPRCPASSRQREPPSRRLRHQRAAWLVRSPPDRGSLRNAGLLSRRDTPPAVAPAKLAGRVGRVRRPGGRGRRLRRRARRGCACSSRRR